MSRRKTRPKSKPLLNDKQVRKVVNFIGGMIAPTASIASAGFNAKDIKKATSKKRSERGKATGIPASAGLGGAVGRSLRWHKAGLSRKINLELTDHLIKEDKYARNRSKIS